MPPKPLGILRTTRATFTNLSNRAPSTMETAAAGEFEPWKMARRTLIDNENLCPLPLLHTLWIAPYTLDEVFHCTRAQTDASK